MLLEYFVNVIDVLDVIEYKTIIRSKLSIAFDSYQNVISSEIMINIVRLDLVVELPQRYRQLISKT